MFGPTNNVETVHSYRDREEQISVYEEPLFVADGACSQDGDEDVLVDAYVKMDGAYARRWDYDFATEFFKILKFEDIEQFNKRFVDISQISKNIETIRPEDYFNIFRIIEDIQYIGKSVTVCDRI